MTKPPPASGHSPSHCWLILHSFTAPPLLQHVLLRGSLVSPNYIPASLPLLALRHCTSNDSRSPLPLEGLLCLPGNGDDFCVWRLAVVALCPGGAVHTLGPGVCRGGPTRWGRGCWPWCARDVVRQVMLRHHQLRRPAASEGMSGRAGVPSSPIGLWAVADVCSQLRHPVYACATVRV